MNTQTTLPASKIAVIAAANAIHSVKTWAKAYAYAAQLFTASGVYYTGFGVTKEASEGGQVVYSIYPSGKPNSKIYFIF